MITLFNYGRMLGLPDPSPFVFKTELMLRMANLPYELNDNGFNKAPKGKLPYITDDGVTVADSLFIRFHIEQKYNINFDAHVSGERQAVLWAAERMVEEHLYHGVVRDRWVDDRNFNAGPAHYFGKVPGLIRPLVIKMVRGSMIKALKAHGMGRHSVAEIHRVCSADIGVLASILGDRLYFGGDEPCGADACFGAFITSLLCPVFESPLRDDLATHANLLAYSERMMARYFADFSTQ